MTETPGFAVPAAAEVVAAALVNVFTVSVVDREVLVEVKVEEEEVEVESSDVLVDVFSLLPLPLPPLPLFPLLLPLLFPST